MRIFHITSAHDRDDIRVYQKMVKSLRFRGHDVSMLVCDSLGSRLGDPIPIHDLGRFKTRLGRLVGSQFRIFRNRHLLRGAICHFHDPELLPLCYLFALRGYKVVFDAHEDLPKQILTKSYIPKYLRVMVSFVFENLERLVCPRLSGIVCATSSIGDKFRPLNSNVEVVNNYPVINDLKTRDESIKKEFGIVYVGALNRIRGFKEMCGAMIYVETEVMLQVAGPLNKRDIGNDLDILKDLPNVELLGKVPREEVLELLSQSIAGLVTFLPAPNHLEAQPNKLFEYMEAGIPIIASDFPLWRDIIEGADCGILVDPQDSKDIARAIDILVNDNSLATRMGKNGRKAVESLYNWDNELVKLLGFYRNMLL